MRRNAFAAVLVSLVAVSAANAQDAAPAPILAPPPAYEDQMLRLSEILGAVHYLRVLCEHEDETTWRTEMEALLEAENPEEMRRQRMVDRFNRGYESFRAVYRTCTPAATLAADRYLREGAALTADLTSRFGSSE